MSKLKYLTLVMLLIASCRKDAERTISTSNGNYNVELLFEVDGCKVYRFYDMGTKYFTICNGSVYWEERKQSGKTSHIDEYEISTSCK